MTRWLVLLHGLFAYVLGFASLIVFMLFIGDWSFAPWRINREGVSAPAFALTVNILLMLLFALQHSVMARPWFKRAITQVIPAAAQRSTYVLASALVLFALCAWWRPLPGVLWRVENVSLAAALYAVQCCGWILIVVASFTISHWELFGLQQAFLHIQGKSAPMPKFTERGLYRFVRHPIQTGILIGIWCTPVMTTTHLLFAASMTAYVLLALQWEERDLVAELGTDYEDYRRRVPMLAPLRILRRVSP